ncbi:gag-asp_proteas domain-containing protein [Cucumis melo var. makuwa]|uniref:Gag-asp_proteas domain-containing protein n=1 Tax=Cucumis melo var. makuwa TaxID=1194695 RepID=A0A5A7VM40_CUCMM|nr:gag-asp_proteas domain-containing protein [Cucumis melo var. makuwa]TYK27983.1 gag-asp_proteas domain-containing protein [Cucumis melo var. makuwa]
MKMNSLNFAIVPLPKYEENFEELDKEYPPQAIYRIAYEDETDFTIWPLILRRQQDKQEEDLLIILHGVPERERLFVERIPNEATFFAWMRDYPLILKQVEESENETLAELLIGHLGPTSENWDKDLGKMKGVNSTALPIFGIARRMRFKLGSWSGQTDFLVVKMDDLGMEFLLEHKVIPMPLAKSLVVTGSNPTVVQTKRRKG